MHAYHSRHEDVTLVEQIGFIFHKILRFDIKLCEENRGWLGKLRKAENLPKRYSFKFKIYKPIVKEIQLSKTILFNYSFLFP